MAVLNQEQYLKRFREILDEMYELTKLKNNDYARKNEALSNFKKFGAVGVLVRISDKFERLFNKMWCNDRVYVMDESLIDTAKDMAVYAIIMRIMMEEEEKAKIKITEIPENQVHTTTGLEQLYS